MGVLVIVGSILGLKGKKLAGGLLVLIPSILSFFSGGGFIIGMILGIVGGALILASKE